MKFLPDQIEVLQEILDDPAIVAAAPTGTNPALIASFVEKVRGFVANNIAKFKTSRLGFQLVTPSGTAGTKLTVSAALTSALSSVMFSVDETLNVHEEKAAQLTVPASCSRTKQANSIEMICYGAQFFVIVSGQVIAEGNVVDSDVPPVPNMWLKPMSRFSDILADHVEEDIKNEKRVRYWYDKEKRIPKVSDLKYESGNSKLGDAIHAELKARNVIRQLSPEYPKIEVVDFDKLSTATGDALAQSWFDDPTAHYDLGCELGIPFEALGDFSIANHVNKILEHGGDADLRAAVELLKDSIHLINCETASRKKATKKPKAAVA